MLEKRVSFVEEKEYWDKILIARFSTKVGSEREGDFLGLQLSLVSCKGAREQFGDISKKEWWFSVGTKGALEK